MADRLLAQTLYERALGARRTFRPYLRQSLANYCIDQFRKRRLDTVALDAATMAVAEGSGSDPFDYEWARTVIEEAVQRMRAECEQAGRGLAWEVFAARVRRPAGVDGG